MSLVTSCRLFKIGKSKGPSAATYGCMHIEVPLRHWQKLSSQSKVQLLLTQVEQQKAQTDMRLAVVTASYLDILVFTEVCINSPRNESQSCSQNNLQQSQARSVNHAAGGKDCLAQAAYTQPRTFTLPHGLGRPVDTRGTVKSSQTAAAADTRPAGLPIAAHQTHHHSGMPLY